MTREALFTAIGQIDARYLEEAAAYTAPRLPRVPVAVRWGAVACLALTVCVIGGMLPAMRHTAVPDPDHTSRIETAVPDTELPAVETPDMELLVTEPLVIEPAMRIALSDIVPNALTELASAAPRWYDPALYDTLDWDREAIAAYYGRDIVPPYTPDGMELQIGGHIVAEKGGAIVADTVRVSYTPAHEGQKSRLSVTVSRLGLLGDCVYLLPENEVIETQIGDTAVTFGYRAMPHGPYDPITKAPSGYTDLYVAELTHDGIAYQIVAEEMPLAEIVRVTASIVYGEAVLVTE